MTCAARAWNGTADMRYSGQSYEINVPWGATSTRPTRRMYGYADGTATEMVTLRRASGGSAPKKLQRSS